MTDKFPEYFNSEAQSWTFMFTPDSALIADSNRSTATSWGSSSAARLCRTSPDGDCGYRPYRAGGSARPVFRAGAQR